VLAHSTALSSTDQTAGQKTDWPFAQFDNSLISQCVDFLTMWMKLRKDTVKTDAACVRNTH
jgi:hypothetical protein